ncbi:MAG: hypothetical protein PHF17_06865 [Arcobacteraceae bacterium]|jgi:hypothetical protein|nr:hypothetical protein [Arcobacteraceae bacterium]
MTTKILLKIELQYEMEIALARANGYEGVMISSDGEYELHYLENGSDKEYIYNIAYEFGWDKFVLILFKNSINVKKLINLTLIDAA